MATNNIAGIPGFDVSAPGGWQGVGNLSNHWGDVRTNGDGSITVATNGDDGGALQQGAGSGYGLYSFDISSTPGDVPGMYALLWPQDDVWPGHEMDVVEVLQGGQQYSTNHWNDNGSNAYQSQTHPGVDVTQSNIYSAAWLPNDLTVYVNGKEVASFDQNIPADAAHGGTNSLAGVGEQVWWSQDLQHGENSITVHNVEYAPPDTVLL